MSGWVLKETINGLRVYYSEAEETEKVILNCALTATAADAIGGIIPGLAIPAVIISCVGAVWVMYGKLCNTLGITIKKNVLKILARAAVANIAANLGGALVAMFAGMLIPGASILASAAVTFITVYLAGYIFLQMILKLAKKSGDPKSFSDISQSDMKAEAAGIKVTKEHLDAVKEIYDQNKESK